MRGFFICGLLTACPVACSGELLTSGLDQPVSIRDAQFKKGELPGVSATLDAGTALTPPLITSLSYKGRIVSAGEPDVPFTGRASLDAAALGVKLKNAGTGYWLLPVGAADFTNNGEFQWTATTTFSGNAPVGLQDLLFVAIDSTGRGGTQTDLPICIAATIPDNLNGCDPKRKPPAVVVSLSWDTQVDLDLEVVTPDGKTVDAKHPTSALTSDAGVTTPTSDDGALDVDSNVGCTLGPLRETLVWQTAPRPGRYLVYANLFDSCGLASVRYNVLIRVLSPGDVPGTYKTTDTYRSSGSLSAAQANGGSQIGTFVTEFTQL